MPKKKSSSPRRRYYKKIKRKKSKPRFSILTGAGMVGGTIGTINDRSPLGVSLYKGLTREWGMDVVGRDVIAQTIGYDFIDKKWRLPSFTVLTIAGAIASKVANKFVRPQTFDAIPFVGKKIKL